MPQQVPGYIDVLDASNSIAIHLNAGGEALVAIGNSNLHGVLSLTNKEGNDTVRLGGLSGLICAGGNGADGDVWLLPGKATDIHDESQATIHLGGAAGLAQLGADGTAGRCVVRDKNAANRVILDGDGGSVVLQTADGHIAVHLESGDTKPAPTIALSDGAGKRTFLVDGVGAFLQIGGGGQNGKIEVLDGHGKAAVTISGDQDGDLVLGSADCAEDFDIAEECVPGSVLVLGDDERLHPATDPYDRRVAGVLSGAGSYRPAVVLDKQIGRPGRGPVALMGKVFCRVDAREKPIAIGDLLTTSATAGHAMKADDPSRGFGAVIGKALRPCATGLGLIPILVALQ